MSRIYAPVSRRLLGTPDVARIYGVGRQAVTDWARKGIMPAIEANGCYYIDPAILPDWQPPRYSYAWFDVGTYEQITRRRTMPAITSGRKLNTRQVAVIFGISEITVGNWVRHHLLPATRERGEYAIDAGTVAAFVPPRKSTAVFDREMYEAIVS